MFIQLQRYILQWPSMFIDAVVRASAAFSKEKRPAQAIDRVPLLYLRYHALPSRNTRHNNCTDDKIDYAAHPFHSSIILVNSLNR